MDNITQGVIGGSLYTLITGKRSNKQFLLGAAIANIPDLDVFIGRLLPLSPLDGQFFHRGIMHSIVFNIFVALILAYVLQKYDAKQKGNNNAKTITYGRYFMGVFISIFCGHLLIDGMTSYGMRYRLPFSGTTSSTDNIFVVDFGMWIITISGLIRYLLSATKQKIAKIILIAVGSYFALTLMIQGYVDYVFSHHYPERKVAIKVLESKTFAEPLQPFLWRHVAKTRLGYYRGYYSLFDKSKDIKREFLSMNNSGTKLVDTLSHEDNTLGKELQKIQSFARGLNRVTSEGSGYKIENMVFGPFIGREKKSDGMFTFDLQPEESGYMLKQSLGNRTVDRQIWTSFWKRVWGN